MNLENIPTIMRAQGWNNGALLLDEWFSGTASVPPAYGPPDTTTISMSWVLSFPRARVVHDRMIAERVWANPKARTQIGVSLRRKGLLGMSGNSFDNFSDPVPDLDGEAVNFRPVSFGFGDLDDLTAALGNFVF